MRKCELCESLAKIYCESDQARLCWDCDAKVHNANFLVAKHSRTLLCHLCQSLTPWTGSGPRFSPTVSVCQNCISNSICREERNNQHDPDSHDDDDDLEREGDSGDDEDDPNGDSGDGGDGDEENQVVPWSSNTPPPVSSSSNTEECSGRFCHDDEGTSHLGLAFSLKRMRENIEPDSQDHHRCLFSENKPNSDKFKDSGFVGISPFMPLKGRKRNTSDSCKGTFQKAKKSPEAAMVFDLQSDVQITWRC